MEHMGGKSVGHKIGHYAKNANRSTRSNRCPPLATNRSPLQRLRPPFWFPMFSTIWGICFSLEAKPNEMKIFDSCTGAYLRWRSKCSSVDQNACFLRKQANSYYL